MSLANFISFAHDMEQYKYDPTVSQDILEYQYLLNELVNMDMNNENFGPLVEYLEGLKSEIDSIINNRIINEDSKKTL